MMDDVPIRKLFVRNIANTVTSEDLRDYFSKYGNVESCYLRENSWTNNCAFITFTNVADAVRAMQDGSRKRIHNRDLRVIAADFWFQPGSMEQRLYNIGKEPSKETNKASERRIANEQYSHKYLQNDTESVSIHMLNDDCFTNIFQYLPIVDRIRIERVCKRWRDLSQDSWHMIKMLDLSPSTWGFSQTHLIHTPLLHTILLKCGRFLTQINLSSRVHNLSTGTLTIIGILCPNLTSIDVGGLTVRASDIRTLTNNCRNVTKLDLGLCYYYTLDDCDNELKYFFEQNQNLEYLATRADVCFSKSLLCLPEQTMHTIMLNGFYDYGNHLSMVLKRLKNLKHLTLKLFTCITERTLESLGQHCKNLRALELIGDFPFDPTVDILSYNDLFHLIDLQILRITFNPNVSDDFLADLVEHCQQLTDLDITGCNHVSNLGLAAVATLARLEKLLVSCLQKITDDGISTFIKSSPQLQFLDLFGCKNITNTTLEVVKHACSNRTNNVMLKMIVNETPILTIDHERLPPLLHIVNIVKGHRLRNKWTEAGIHSPFLF